MKCDDWGLDVVVTGSQKGLMLPPGLAFAFVSEKAFNVGEMSNLPKFYFSYQKARAALEKGTTPFTPAISLIVGANTSLQMIREEGIENVWKRHSKMAETCRAGIKALGLEGLQSVSENAIIGANYIQAGLKDRYELAADRYCMHETVLSATRQKSRGVTGLDIAKRLLDFGIHAPTMYFPMIVDEALMVEPTESESKETLDHFIAVMRQIDDEIGTSPDLIHEAPHDLPVTRLDEATAARKPILRWSAEE